jgi:hypothetical protein
MLKVGRTYRFVLTVFLRAMSVRTRMFGPGFFQALRVVRGVLDPKLRRGLEWPHRYVGCGCLGGWARGARVRHDKR